MLILVLLGIYFDAVVVFVTRQTLLFRLALAILCVQTSTAVYIAQLTHLYKNVHLCPMEDIYNFARII